MQHEPIADRLIHLVPTRVWLLIGSALLALAAGSSWVLLWRLGEGPKDKAYSLYDAVVRFTHETIRLTFKTDKNQPSVFVAPIGLLNQKTEFIWVQSYQDFNSRSADEIDEPKAPARLLDSDWQPVFSDDDRRKEF